MRSILMSLALLGLTSAAAAAQEVAAETVAVGVETVDTSRISSPEGADAKIVTASCTGGIVYDDNGFGDGYAVGPGQARFVQKFDLAPGTTSLDQACICLTRSSGAPSSVPVSIVVYNDNGGGGAPGTLIATTIPVTVTSIPVFPAVGFYNFNLVGSGLVLPDTGVFVGADWDADHPGGNIFMCGDRSVTTTQRTIYGSGNGGTSFSTASTLFPTSPPRAMGIRVDPATVITGCTPSATAMCLNNNRFKVEALFATAANPILAAASTVKLTDDSGYLWFFNSANIEVVVKVLNACGVNNRYWVFAAGLTNVEVRLTVTDTQNPGVFRTYVNPLNQPFPPLQDTGAFATCP